MKLRQRHGNKLNLYLTSIFFYSRNKYIMSDEFNSHKCRYRPDLLIVVMELSELRLRHVPPNGI